MFKKLLKTEHFHLHFAFQYIDLDRYLNSKTFKMDSDNTKNRKRISVLNN